jgi:hydroxylamine reductase (hybrid-cluster protein)
MTGDLLSVEKEPVKAADAMLAHIETNRKKNGI